LTENDNFNLSEWKTNSKSRYLVTKCGPEKVLGGYRVGAGNIWFKRTFRLPAHTRVTISFVAFILDSWDYEDFIVKVGNEEVYKKTF